MYFSIYQLLKKIYSMFHLTFIISMFIRLFNPNDRNIQNHCRLYRRRISESTFLKNKLFEQYQAHGKIIFQQKFEKPCSNTTLQSSIKGGFIHVLIFGIYQKSFFPGAQEPDSANAAAPHDSAAAQGFSTAQRHLRIPRTAIHLLKGKNNRHAGMNFAARTMVNFTKFFCTAIVGNSR